MAFAVGLEEPMASGRPEFGAQLSLQPDTRRITREQLTLELYSRPVMVEAKYVEVDERQLISTQAVTPILERNVDEQGQNIAAIHENAINELDELLVAFQKLSVTRTLSRSTLEFTMPARMRQKNIHSLLQLLQHWLHKIFLLVHVAYIMMMLSLGRLPILEAGLVLPTLFWTFTRLRVIELDKTESYVSAYPVGPSIVCLCAQFAPRAVDDEPEDDDILTVAPSDRNCVWPASSPIRAGLMSSFLGFCALALSGPRSRVFHWTVLFASFSRLTLAIPAPTNEPGKDSIRLSAPTDLLADLAVVVLAVVILVIAHLLIALKVKPLHVWATLMACSAFGWWCIRSDVTASLVLSCA
ncbi:MAG: hypothetical protein Q9203_006109 [Teloschistes exilis]